jgi:hypothetical protein
VRIYFLTHFPNHAKNQIKIFEILKISSRQCTYGLLKPANGWVPKFNNLRIHGNAARLCKPHLNYFMLLEYQRMKELSVFSSNEKLIFPHVLDFGMSEGVAYYVMERIEGVMWYALLVFIFR